MSELPYSKSADRLSQELPCSTAAAVAVDLEPWLGRWINTRDDSRCIESFTLQRDEHSGGFVLGVTPHGAEPWDEVEVTPCAATVDSSAGVAFFANCDLGFIEHRLAANGNKGLIIIAAYSLFKDGSRRHDYFNREFFYHQPLSEM